MSGGTGVAAPDGVPAPLAPAAAAAPAPPAPAANAAIAALNNAGNVDALARVIMSEASVGNATERAAVGFTVLNRMLRNGQTQVSGVWRAYARDQDPTPAIRALAAELLRGVRTDPTGGATHYYSPRSMPAGSTPAADLARFDTAGGLETIPGHGETYRPGWAAAADFTLVTVPEVRDWNYRFYRVGGNGPVR